MFWETLQEDFFFLEYHMNKSYQEVVSMPINVRRWRIERFMLQKQREHEAWQAARKNNK